MELGVSHLITFVVGAFGGAAAEFYGVNYTEQRHQNEAKASAIRFFKEMTKKMPKLIAEMHNDVVGDSTGLTREFWVLGSRLVAVGSSKRRFGYYESEHQDLINKLDILERGGFVENITSNSVTTYRMTEGYVELLVAYGK